jgi:hypothetical protein
MNVIRFLAVISGFALIFGCAGATNSSGGGGLPPYNGSPPLEGPWEFTGSSTTLPGQHIYVGVDLSQSASTLSATQLEVLTGGPSVSPVSGCPIPLEPSFSGSLSGAVLTVTLTSGTKTVQLAGEVAPDGKSISGTYSGGCIPGDNGGTFTAGVISPLSGTFNGTLTDAHNNPAQTSMQISDNSGPLFTFTGTGQGNDSGNGFSFSFVATQTGAYFSGGGTLAMAGTVGPPAPITVSGHLNPTATVVDHFFMGEPSGSGPIPIFFIVYMGTLSK